MGTTVRMTWRRMPHFSRGKVSSPVRVQWSRKDEFAWEPYAPAMVVRLQGGLDEDGRVIAWEYEGWSPTHGARPRSGSDLLAGQLISGRGERVHTRFVGGHRNAQTNYEFPNQEIRMHWISRSPLRASAFRSLGAFANTFANESFVDELSAACGQDPIAFRLNHLSDSRSRHVLETAAERAGWNKPLPEDEGLGISFIRYENQKAYVAAVAHVRVDLVNGDVRVKRFVIAHDCGLVINPDGLRNQIEGNVIQATSRALKGTSNLGRSSNLEFGLGYLSYPEIHRSA